MNLASNLCISHYFTTSSSSRGSSQKPVVVVSLSLFSFSLSISLFSRVVSLSISSVVVAGRSVPSNEFPFKRRKKPMKRIYSKWLLSKCRRRLNVILDPIFFCNKKASPHLQRPCMPLVPIISKCISLCLLINLSRPEKCQNGLKRPKRPFICQNGLKRANTVQKGPKMCLLYQTGTSPLQHWHGKWPNKYIIEITQNDLTRFNMITYYPSWTVWPDAYIKKSNFVLKLLNTVSCLCRLNLKGTVFKNSPRSFQLFGSFCKNLFSKTSKIAQSSNNSHGGVQ